MLFKILCFLIIFYGVTIKSKRALNMLQQNLYNENNRYLKWLKHNLKSAFWHLDILSLICFCIALRLHNLLSIALILLGLIFILMDTEVIKYHMMLEKTKKPLVKTKRIQRQIITLYLLNLLPLIIYSIWPSTFSPMLIIATIILILNYFMVFIIKVINSPIEHLVYKHFWHQAQKKLASLTNLKVIGITGSYGKTSSKNILNEVLSVNYLSHPTPKNFNTDVGLMATINNDLTKFDEIFIAEMGAYRVGRIQNACNLVHPQYGILTTIGQAHLETFGSQENIIKTKFELIESLPPNGVAFLNGDDPFQVNHQVKNPVKKVWYGINNHEVDCYATDIKCSKDGSSFNVHFKDSKASYPFSTKLLGNHNIYNILSALAVGHEFNIPINKLQIAVKKINAIEHRLELKKLGNMYQIDDAYNSNPVGAKMALDVLDMMPGTKVVVTPGMVELGKLENTANYNFGTQIASVADYVILVGEKQTKPIYEGLIAKKYKKDNIIITNDVREAYVIVNRLKGNQDIYALFENDLPDIYNE